MEYSLRSFRVINRLFRRPLGFATYKSAATVTAKEETNLELLHSYNADIRNGGIVPVFRRALLFPSRVALQDDNGVYTYAGLHQAASNLSKQISAQLVGETSRTIPYLCGNNATHVIVQWAIWMSGNIALPLASLYPEEMLKYFIEDSTASMVICSPDYEKLLRPITLNMSKPLLVTEQDAETAKQYEPNSQFIKAKEDLLTDSEKTNEWYGKSDAMLIYTSGTTSKPKGVVWSHKMLSSQISSLHTAWQYSAHDVVLHCLPLHHIHGQLNSLNASLAAGARILLLPSFAPHTVWDRLLSIEPAKDEPKVTVFHGVPAMYARLASEHERMFGGDRATADYVRTTLANRIRLMCAGSAPLPETLANKWEELTGHKLLERYGMSEVGMSLSNPYRPADRRAVGSVGVPLPGVSARISTFLNDRETPLITVDTPMCETQISLQRLGLVNKEVEDDSPKEDVVSDKYEWIYPTVAKHDVSEGDETFQGELLLRGTGVFSRYWNRSPSSYQKDFTEDGWFRTGDTAMYSDGIFRIQGRTSIDIIKTAGYKVSALQIESAILEHPSVDDAAVLGIPHETVGEVIAAVVTLKTDQKLDLKELRTMLGKKLATYQLPRTMVIADKMPRNVMGKLDKKEIKKVFAKELKLKKEEKLIFKVK